MIVLAIFGGVVAYTLKVIVGVVLFVVGMWALFWPWPHAKRPRPPENK